MCVGKYIKRTTTQTKEIKMDRKELENLIFDTYKIKGDNPFEEDFDTTVFRHVVSKKWFALVMNISKNKLGFPSEEKIDVVNFKCAPEVIESLAGEEPGIYHAYHMNKMHWLTVALDGSCDSDTVKWLLEISYDLTMPKKKNKREQ